MPREYPQKAALVTGGAQGIGSDIARLLSQRGYRVAIADVKPAREGGMLFIRCDISREAAVRSCVRQVVKRFGRLDALVNNAGIAGPNNGPVEKLALREWNRRIGVNLTGAFLMTKHAAPHLRRAQCNRSATRKPTPRRKADSWRSRTRWR